MSHVNCVHENKGPFGTDRVLDLLSHKLKMICSFKPDQNRLRSLGSDFATFGSVGYGLGGSLQEILMGHDTIVQPLNP